MSDLLLMGGGRGSYGEPFVYAGNLEYEFLHGETNPQTLFLNLSSEGTYDFTIDWGDGTSDVITAYDQPETTHEYPAGTYTVSISGQIDNTTFPASKGGQTASFFISSVNEWGNFKLDTSGTFYNTDFAQGVSLSPYTGDAQDYRLAFGSLDAQNATLDLNGWDTSNATSMKGVFGDSVIGNLLINNWDVSNVTDMSRAFAGHKPQGSATNISNWNVSNVTDFSYMFYGGYNFLLISDITGWDTSSATNMEGMFQLAHTFNQNISTWNVGNVQNFQTMFNQNFGFNQPIGSWNMSSATDISGMFTVSIFNQPIGNWNTSNVTRFVWVFGDIFTNTKTPFNQDISNWDFTGCANNASLAYFFGVNFGGYTAFCSMSRANYEALLISWASQAANMPTGMIDISSDFVYGAGSAAETARNTLVNTYGWIITDGGAV